MIRSQHGWPVWLAIPLTILAAGPAVDAADLKFYPDDTEVVLTVNIRQILNSELVKSQKATAKKIQASVDEKIPEEAMKYLKMAGLDPVKDLISITVAAAPSKDPEKALIIVDGDFQPDKLHATLEEVAKNHADAVKISKSGEHKIIEVTTPEGKQFHLAVASKKVLVASLSRDALKSALARGNGEQESNLKKEIKTLIGTMHSGQSISAVATGKALAKALEGAKLPNNPAQGLAPALQGIESVNANITVGKDIQIQLGVSTRDAETANTLAKGVNFGLLLIKGVVAQKAMEEQKLLPVVDVVNTFRATIQGNSVTVRAEVSADNLEKLIKNFSPVP